MVPKIWNDTLAPTTANINLTNTTGKFVLYPNRNMRQRVNYNSFNHLYYRDYRGYTNNGSQGGTTGAHRDGTVYGILEHFAIYDQIVTYDEIFNSFSWPATIPEIPGGSYYTSEGIPEFTITGNQWNRKVIRGGGSGLETEFSVRLDIDPSATNTWEDWTERDLDNNNWTKELGRIDKNIPAIKNIFYKSAPSFTIAFIATISVYQTRTGQNSKNNSISKFITFWSSCQ